MTVGLEERTVAPSLDRFLNVVRTGGGSGFRFRNGSTTPAPC